MDSFTETPAQAGSAARVENPADSCVAVRTVRQSPSCGCGARVEKNAPRTASASRAEDGRVSVCADAKSGKEGGRPARRRGAARGFGSSDVVGRAACERRRGRRPGPERVRQRGVVAWSAYLRREARARAAILGTRTRQTSGREDSFQAVRVTCGNPAGAVVFQFIVCAGRVVSRVRADFRRVERRFDEARAAERVALSLCGLRAEFDVARAAGTVAGVGPFALATGHPAGRSGGRTALQRRDAGQQGKGQRDRQKQFGGCLCAGECPTGGTHAGPLVYAASPLARRANQTSGWQRSKRHAAVLRRTHERMTTGQD